jgi:hypothetical protein
MVITDWFVSEICVMLTVRLRIITQMGMETATMAGVAHWLRYI